MKKTLLFVGALLFLASVTLPAAAAEPDDAAKQEARELMTRGRQERDRSDLQAALTSFRQADEIMHVPTTGLEVAKSLAALGMLVEASVVTKRIAAIPREMDEPEVFVTARSSAEELGRELDARIARVSFAHSESSESTRITLDGKLLAPGTMTAGVPLNPGRHVAVAERAGVTRTRVLIVAEGASITVTFDFTAAAADAAQAGDTSAARKSSTMRPSTLAIYGLAGLAVVGGGAGLGLGIWANQRKSELDAACAPRCRQPAVDQLRARYVTANVVAAVGVAAGIAAVTVYLVRPSEDEPKGHPDGGALSISANAGTEPGVSVSGSF